MAKYRRITEKEHNFRRKISHHQIKAPIFPETVFDIETTYEAQFYFSMEDKPEIDN